MRLAAVLSWIEDSSRTSIRTLSESWTRCLLGSDTDELGLLSKGRPVTAEALNAVTQTRDGFADGNVFVPVLVEISELSAGYSFGGGLGHCGGRLRKSLKRYLAAPHAVQQHGQLSGHGNDRAFLAPFAPTGS